MKHKPLYRRLYQELAETIRRGDYREDGRLPSESELSKRYNASRQPIRLAVNRLQAEGLVERIPGKGTFVLDPRARAGNERPVRIAFLIELAKSGDGDSSEGRLLHEARIMRGIQSVFSDRSSLSLQSYSPEGAPQSELINRFSSTRDFDGLILVSPPRRTFILLEKLALPAVVIGHLPIGINMPHVSLNLFKAGYDTVRELLPRGHLRFGLIALDLRNEGTKRYIAGAENALVDYHLSWDPVLRRDAATVEECLEGADELLESGASCLVLDIPEYAPSLCHHLLNRRLRVPQDVSIFLLEMQEDLLRRPHIYTGFGADYFRFGVRAGTLLKRLLWGDRPRQTESRLVIDLDFFEGETLGVAPAAAADRDPLEIIS